jgi:hypothetical protein
MSLPWQIKAEILQLMWVKKSQKSSFGQKLWQKNVASKLRNQPFFSVYPGKL